MEWNKLVLRPLLPEELDDYPGFNAIWDGPLPEEDEEVLVCIYGHKVCTDTWIAFDDGFGFENTESTVIFWMPFPEPPEEVRKL